MNRLVGNLAYVASATLAVAAWQGRDLNAQSAPADTATARQAIPATAPVVAPAAPTAPVVAGVATPVATPVAASVPAPASVGAPVTTLAADTAVMPPATVVAQNDPAVAAPNALFPLNGSATDVARAPVNRVELLPGTPGVRAQRKADAEGRQIVAKKKRVAKKRKPASIDPEDTVQVFSETTDFEKMVTERQSFGGGRNPAAFAPSARVISVRRELGLTTADANAAPQDIILNAGLEAGIDEGMVLSVARSVPILDPYRENQQKQLDVEFARIRILRAEQGLSVARIDRVEPIRTGLVVGTRAILVGDYVGKFTK